MRIPIFSSSNKPKQNQRSSPNLTSSSELGFHRPTHNGVILNSAQFALRRISTTILCTISRLEGLQREHTAPATLQGTIIRDSSFFNSCAPGNCPRKNSINRRDRGRPVQLHPVGILGPGDGFTEPVPDGELRGRSELPIAGGQERRADLVSTAVSRFPQPRAQPGGCAGNILMQIVEIYGKIGRT